MVVDDAQTVDDRDVHDQEKKVGKDVVDDAVMVVSVDDDIVDEVVLDTK